VTDQEAADLRARFEGLPDAYILTLNDVELVPAVLGRGVNKSYSSTNGRLISLVAYETSVATAGDLRKLLEAHPRTAETDEENDFGTQLGRGIAEGLGPMVRAMVSEIAHLKARYRTLYEMAAEKDPSFPIEFNRRLHSHLERKYSTYCAQVASPRDTPAQEKEYDDAFKDSTAEDLLILRAIVGDDIADQVEREQAEWLAKIGANEEAP
jgi:hypothetical protein